MPGSERKGEGQQGGLAQSADSTPAEQPAQLRQGTQVVPFQLSVVEQELKPLHEVSFWEFFLPFGGLFSAR